MTSRLVHLLLVALFLLGQVDGWLHEMSHHVGHASQPATFEAGVSGGGNPAAPTDPIDQCLVCLTIAALVVALPTGVMALALLALRFAMPAGAMLLPVAIHRFAHRARGPPAVS